MQTKKRFILDRQFFNPVDFYHVFLKPTGETTHLIARFPDQIL